MQEHRNLGIFTIDRVDFIVEEIRCSCGWAEQVPASGAAQRWLAGRFGNHIAAET